MKAPREFYDRHYNMGSVAMIATRDAEHEAEKASLRAEVERLKGELAEATELFRSMPAFHSTRSDEIPALSRWITKVIAFLATAEEKATSEPAHDEDCLCDDCDPPDCGTDGVHQPYCRDAGKLVAWLESDSPVTDGIRQKLQAATIQAAAQDAARQAAGVPLSVPSINERLDGLAANVDAETRAMRGAVDALNGRLDTLEKQVSALEDWNSQRMWTPVPETLPKTTSSPEVAHPAVLLGTGKVCDEPACMWRGRRHAGVHALPAVAEPAPHPFVCKRWPENCSGNYCTCRDCGRKNCDPIHAVPPAPEVRK